MENVQTGYHDSTYENLCGAWQLAPGAVGDRDDRARFLLTLEQGICDLRMNPPARVSAFDNVAIALSTLMRHLRHPEHDRMTATLRGVLERLHTKEKAT